MSTVASVARAAGTVPPPSPPSPAPAPARLVDRRGALVWLVVVTVALVWGTFAVAGSGVGLRAAPLYGRWSWAPGPGLVPAASMAAATVAWGPRVADRCRWGLLLVVTGGWAVGWAVALAASDGWSRVTGPLTTDHEYEPAAAGIGSGLGDLGDFLGGYVDHLGSFPIHVQGHPPGPVVLAWSLDRVGLGGAGWMAAVALTGWGVAVAAALVALRALGDGWPARSGRATGGGGQAGEAAARRAAPALAILPAAVWAGTSVDALFAGLVAVAVAAMVVAAVHGSARWAVVAGGVAGLGLLSTYGAAVGLLIGVVTIALVASAPARLLAWVAVGGAVPLVLAAAAGFRWPEGLAATGDAYWEGVASVRPAGYLTLVGNPAALALATGPAVAAGLWAAVVRVRGMAGRWGLAVRRGVPAGVLLPLAALAAVVVADLSQMSRGEVERIWLPFVPWLALAGPGNRRGWLAAQAAVALTLESTLASAW